LRTDKSVTVVKPDTNRMPSRKGLKEALFDDACLSALLKELVGSFSAYSIVPKGESDQVMENAEKFASYCSSLRAKDGCAACVRCNSEHEQEAALNKKAIAYMCHAGLLDIAGPVFVGSEHVATLFCGQRRYADKEQNEISRQRARELEVTHKFSPGELMRLWEEITPATPGEIEEARRKLEIISQYLSASLERGQKYLHQLAGALNTVGNIRAVQQNGLQALFDHIVVEATGLLGLKECAVATREGTGDLWRIRAAVESDHSDWVSGWVGAPFGSCEKCQAALAGLENGESVWESGDRSVLHELPNPPRSKIALLPIPLRPEARGVLILGFDVPWPAVDTERRTMAESLGLHAGLSVNNLLLEAQVARMTDQCVAFAKGSLERTIAAPLAHEVRNGLQNICGAIARLDATVRSAAGSEDRALLDRLKDESNSLARLVQSMLDVSKGVTTRKRWFYLNDIVLDAIALVRLMANRSFSEKNLYIEPSFAPELKRPSGYSAKELEACNKSSSGDPRPPFEQSAPPGRPVYADPDQVKQVVVNLLTNAMKASSDRGRQVIRIATNLKRGSSSRTVADDVEIRVADYGCGFLPESLQKLFEPAFSTFGGSGLGLCVVKTLIEREHQGCVTASSPGLGGGATFTVTLPRIPIQ